VFLNSPFSIPDFGSIYLSRDDENGAPTSIIMAEGGALT
jgi:hypothetical protein